MTRDSLLSEWLAQRRGACRLEIRGIPWRESKAWLFEHGRLVHATGGFFSVVGIQVSANVTGLDGQIRPIIDQPEVGILGFLVRARGTANEWLIQAKAEPGNVGRVQLAPSVQATRSNFMRVHGGAPTPYLDCFAAPDGAHKVIADSLQSEQGNRFLGKYNRNMTVQVAGDGPDPVGEDWCWAGSAALRAMLAIDYAVNTDARSVLVASDWRLLADGAPFGRWRGTIGWGARLLGSFESGDDETDAGLVCWLEAQRERVRLEVRTLDLDSMPGWELTSDSISSCVDGSALVRAYAIEANSREVDRWDQPLVLSHRQEEVVLVCQQRGGVQHFLFRASAEAGFRERVQLGPTWQSDDATAGNSMVEALLSAIRKGRERDARLQSDEGGRFFRSVSRYRIVELDEVETIDIDARGYVWMSLGQVQRLVAIQGMFSNEARSAVSLILAWL